MRVRGSGSGWAGPRSRIGATLGELQWARGLRAGFAVCTAMVVCHALRHPMGWAALGGFEAILVDNGGPYRSRMKTIGTLLLGGYAACAVAALGASPFWLACVAAGLFCFAVTYTRVVAQAIASTSVIILVIYFAEVGAGGNTLAGALGHARDFALGGAWAALLSLGLWPLDPFRPARLAVARCYEELARFAAGMAWTEPHSVEREAMRARTHTFQRRMRLALEEARTALGATAARSASRTVRARNLAVLLETADILFAMTLRWTELLERAGQKGERAALEEAIRWLGGAERAVEAGLEDRPADGGASYAPEGSHTMEFVRGRMKIVSGIEALDGTVIAHLAADERDALQNVEIAFESVRAVWHGMDLKPLPVQLPGGGEAGNDTQWWDPLRTNWTRDSVMLRHAMRVGIVAAADVLLLRVLQVQHGSWLAMTSLIVLQPYGSGTLRRSVQRVAGTVAGGVLAAVLAGAIRSEVGILLVITVTSVMTLACYAVDYGWYAFFLTPTFVLLSMPHLRDWRFAEVRVVTTIVGACVALVAMRVLWPEREAARLGELLGRAAAAQAEYLRAVCRFWATPKEGRVTAERGILAPSRRMAGLRILDAEEALDRMLQEPALLRRGGVADGRAEAMTFITYLRRLARSGTMVAAMGRGGERDCVRMGRLGERMDALATALLRGGSTGEPEWERAEDAGKAGGLAEQQMRRMERQTGVLERAAAALTGGSHG